MTLGINPYRFHDYRSYLKAVYELRKQKNQAYSLRAFARDIAFHPSRISVIFRRQSHLSLEKLEAILSALSVPHQDQQYLLLLHRRDHCIDSEEQRNLHQKLHRLRQTFRFQRFDQSLLEKLDWRHFTCLAHYNPSDNEDQIRAQLAVILQMSQADIKKILSDLKGAGLMPSKDKSPYLTGYHTSSTQRSATIRSFHQRLIDRGLQAIADLPIDQRYVRSLIVSLQPRQYSALVEMIDNFLQACCDKLDIQPTSNGACFGISIQMFPLVQSKQPLRNQRTDAAPDSAHACSQVETEKSVAELRQTLGKQDQLQAAQEAKTSN